MSEKMLIMDASIAICGNPNCINCRTKILRTVSRKFASQVTDQPEISSSVKAFYDLMLAAALQSMEAEGDNVNEFMETAKAAFDMARKLRVAITMAEAQGHTKQ